MNENKNLTIEETFKLAVENHQNNKLDVAQELYNKILKIDPYHLSTLNNLAAIFQNLGENQKAKDCYEKAIEIDPDYIDAYYNLGVVHQNLEENQKAINCYEKVTTINPHHFNGYYNRGVAFKKLGENQKAINCYIKAIEIDPNNIKANNNLGVIHKELGKFQEAINYYEKVIEIDPNNTNTINNLGVTYKLLGQFQKAKLCYEKVIEIDPSHLNANNNLGNILTDLGQYKHAKLCYEKAIEIDPNFTVAYWNLHSTASNIDDALTILKKAYEIDKNYTKAKIVLSALQGYKGNHAMFNEILSSPDSNHPYTRSVKWVFSLPKLPKIFFNKYDFFDAIVSLSESSRPFYEFGVWNGISFQYLINTFKRGFGFDTFSGLPESWHGVQPIGTYSSFGAIPKIEGGEFIAGKFEDTLPKFFTDERPLASLINFDADLYSSTLCALNYSNKVIDEKTILIFDELIMNNNWEVDEYKALNEFCDNLGFSYEVIAISLFSKQVAVKLEKKVSR